MRLLSTVLSFGLLFLAALPASAATKNLCQTYAAAGEKDLKVVKEVVAFKATLTKEQMGMIQATIVARNPAKPHSAEAALAEFTDKQNQGSNGGNLTYTEMKFGKRDATVVRVTYFPGDNEYGAIFKTWKSNKDEAGDFVDMIGFVSDGSIECLVYSDAQE